MNNKTTMISIGIIFLATAGIGVVASSHLPVEVVSHWNALGQPDGTTPRLWALTLIPIMMLGISVLLMLLPLIDPLKENIARFRPVYNLMMVVLAVYLLYIHLLTILWNLGVQYDINIMLVPAMSGLFFAMGYILKRSHRNWFVGIRTPWTLSSDTVWKKTHDQAAVLFKVMAAIVLAGLLIPEGLVAILMIPLFGLVIYLTVYSYVLYRQEKKQEVSHNPQG